MKTTIIWICGWLGLGLLAGCASSNSGTASSAAPKISGYIDTSAQATF